MPADLNNGGTGAADRHRTSWRSNDLRQSPGGSKEVDQRFRPADKNLVDGQGSDAKSRGSKEVNDCFLLANNEPRGRARP